MKQTKFFLSGTDVGVVEFDPTTTLDNLPAKVYTVKHDPMRGFYLSIHKDCFDVPEQVYGSSKHKAYKIYSTYKLRKKSTGVLLTGDKGAGKTMLSSLVCNMALSEGVPVLLVNEPFSGTDFNQFIDSIGECVIFYDEFAKTFEKKNEQDGLLTLLDGTSSNKRLFIMTENNENMVNEFILDRPGRVFYHFRFDKLEKAIIEEYCEAHGVSSIVKDIMHMYDRMLEFSFDILSAIVEEHKRYPDGDFTELMADLNFTVFGGGSSVSQLFVEKIISDDDNPKDYVVKMDNRKVNDPLESGNDFYISWADENESNEERGAWVDIDNLSEISNTHVVFYLPDHGVYVICRKLPPKSMSKKGLLS